MEDVVTRVMYWGRSICQPSTQITQESRLVQSIKKDALLFLLLTLLVATILIKIDAFELFISFAEAHEDWDLDNIVITLFAMGGLGYIFSFHYLFQLHRENQLRQKAEHDAIHMANHDLLTGLPNRLSLQQFGSALLENPPANFYVSILDLDGFKAVNDLYGHGVGDQLLQEIAYRLHVQTQAPDFACRLSGDEFALIFTQTENQRDCHARTESIGEILKQTIRINDHDIHISATFGVARYPDDGQNISQLLSRANIALYQGKSLTRSSVRFYNATLDHQVEERSRIEAALRRGIEQGTLTLHYQPIIELDTGHIIGFEALARLYDPELGQIPPCKFIEAAEHTGLIIQTSEYLLRQACAIAKTWPENMLLAFNLSPMQLRSSNLVAGIQQTIVESKLAPQRLILEITESAIFASAIDADAIFTQLRTLGIRFALDDFGTGYSSFSRLADFAFEHFKIDRSFIERIGTSTQSESILNSIIQLAGTLSANSLAEGIETPAQLAWVKAHGCRFAQGYYFSRPIPSDAIAALIQTTNHS